MSAQVKLAWGKEGSSYSNSISLYGFTSGIGLARDGWIPAVAADGDEYVTEAMTLMIKGIDQNTVATITQYLEDKIQEIAHFNQESSEAHAVWLVNQLPDETYSRRALVTALSGAPAASMHGPPMSPGNWIRQFTLGLTRRAMWESESPYSFETDLTVNALGGTYDYGTRYRAIGGTMPARIWKCGVQDISSPALSNPLTEVWLGIYCDRYGDRDRYHFQPKWEAEDGTAGTDTVAYTDSGASGGGKLQCSFATTETLAARATVCVGDVTTQYSDQRGSYSVLLRAKASSASTTRVRLLDGFSGESAWRTQSRVVIDSTDWKLYDLGTVSIPPGRGWTASASLQSYALRVEAERVSGSGSLSLDCLVLIPRDGGVHFSDAQIWQNINPPHYVAWIYRHADGSLGGETLYDTYPITALAVEGGNFWLPPGTGKMVLAAQRTTGGHVLTDACKISMSYYPRWRFLRGLDY